MSEKQVQYEIHYHSDGSHTIVLHMQSVESAISASAILQEIERNIRLSSMVDRIRGACTQVNGLPLFPKCKGISDEIRLVASVTAAYPDGFPQDAISTQLDISGPSRDAYINWSTKTSSRYLRYNSDTKKVYVTPDGIAWIHQELVNRQVQGFQ